MQFITVRSLKAELPLRVVLNLALEAGSLYILPWSNTPGGQVT